MMRNSYSGYEFNRQEGSIQSMQEIIQPIELSFNTSPNTIIIPCLITMPMNICAVSFFSYFRFFYILYYIKNI